MILRRFASKRHLEFRRQGFHLVAGCLLVFLLHQRIIDARTLVLFVILSCIFSFILARTRIPGVSDALELFERDEERISGRGRGAITFLIGILLAVVLFPERIAYASLLILAVGDSISPLVGRYLGSTPHPANRAKNIEGGIAGGFAGALAASIFVGLVPGMIASFFTMSVEMAIPKATGWLAWPTDDNLIIPLAAGIVLTIIP